MKNASTISILNVAANVAFITLRQFDPNTGIATNAAAESVNLPDIQDNRIPQIEQQITTLQNNLSSLQEFLNDAKALTA